MWHPRRTPRQGREAEVVAAAEGLLTGRLFEVPAPGRLSPWVLINFLAHSTRDQLGRMVRLYQNTHPASWNAALAYLGTEILGLSGDAAGLLRLQRHDLIPLELELLDHRLATVRTPKQLTTMVMGAVGANGVQRD